MADPAPTPAPGTVDLDPGRAWEKVDAMLDGAVALLPNLALAVAFFGGMVLVGFGAARLLRSTLSSRGRENLADVLASLLKWAVWIAGLLLAITIVVPSVKPGDLLAGLGVGSVAIGFAFKDILQNLFAGLLLLIRQPFEVGDQIATDSHAGTVERIETRATILRTFDGKRVVVPNSEIYTDAVVVQTAFASRRSEYDVGIGYGDDIEVARERMIAAMEQTEGVLSEPAPEVLVRELAGSSVNLRARWWTAPDQATVVHTFDRVLTRIKVALDEAHVDMPYPTQVVLFHDQTEATDGDRTAQREGWPTGEEPPASARISKALEEEDEAQAAR